MAVFFVNNAVYGMTGGQMAPTTLIGQRTTTSPTGRTAINDGYPVHACEVLNSLYAPVYIERCSLADSKRIRQARQAVRKALQIQVEGKGYAFVEFLSPCPTNLKMDPVDAAQYMIEHMEQEFPLGKLRDRSDEVVAPPRTERIYDADAIRQAFLGPAAATPSLEADSGSAAGTARIKVAGFGGQGVLSLGLMLAYAGQRAGRKTTWFPSYGPEQRGGTANCSVVLSDAPIGSPVVSETDILIALNRPSLERFAADVADQGVIFYDDTVGEVELPAHIDKAIAVPAFRIAAEKGVAKAANTAMLGAIAASGVSRLPMETFDAVLTEVFGQKAKLLKVNRAVFEAAAQWAAEHASQSPVRA
jgi:2-oxoisovalerate ferredoxin oxidoreductase beta subunit